MFPGHGANPIQAVHQVALQLSSHLKACLFFPKWHLHANNHEAWYFSLSPYVYSCLSGKKPRRKSLIQIYTESGGIVFPPRRSKLLSHQMRHEATSALVQAISCLDCSHSIFSLIGLLGSESQLFILRSRRPADDPRPIEASYLFFANARRGYLALHHSGPRSLMDDGELATVCATWCLVRYVCSKNCMLSAPKQRLDSLTGMTPMVF